MANLIIRRNNKLKILLNHERKLSNQISVSNHENDDIPESDVANNVTINCNKSGLLNQHRNILHNRKTYKEPSSWIHLTEKYQRKVYGVHGADSGISPRICFSAKSEPKLYEDFNEADTLLAKINKYRIQQKAKSDEILKREHHISQQLEKLDLWKQELNARVAKKEADALAAKVKKERLIEEVRRHFGYKVDPRDERFKEVLEQKEREDKKKQKEAKRQAKEQKLMSKLVGKSA